MTAEKSGNVLLKMGRSLLRWILLLLPVSITIGSVVVFFLWALSSSIHFRFAHPWLLYGLPLAGLLIHWIYQSVGKSSERGNALLFEQIEKEEIAVPARMSLVILCTTLITHVFGGSAGREGTAVQIGGSLAACFGRWFKLDGSDRSIVLMAGIAAGFGAVFGTPLTGGIFALEVLAMGRIRFKAFLPALFAAFIGDLTVRVWQIHHTHYHIDALTTPSGSSFFNFEGLLLLKVLLAAVAFGLASYFFTWFAHQVKSVCLSQFKHKWMMPVVGGCVLIALTIWLGKPDYLSLGVDAEYPGAITIPSAFHAGGADAWSWLLKTIYTGITLGTGFKGGEVTPLFYIGATLGNTLSALLDAPVSLFAALGFIAVFAGATNTPLACTCMGAELFGPRYLIFFGIACFTAYLCSGHLNIYGLKITASESKLKEKPYASIKSYLHEKLSRYRF